MPPPPRKAVPRRPNQPRVVVDRPILPKQPHVDPTKTHCDICWGKHGKRGMPLHHCADCHVAVHFECYGYVPLFDTNKNTTESFRCWPCRAVGTTIPGRNPKNRQITSHTMDQRPTECSLCSVKDDTQFPHAMHPLYDYYGLTGRQVELPATPTQPTRLAWVHTLCANVVCQLVSGVVYGCTLDGSYDGDDDDTDTDTDDAPPNPLLQDSSALSQLLDVSRTVHHYTYVFCPPGQAENDYTRLIRVHQRDLKCCFCRRSDLDNTTSLRIPVQCCAGNATEFDEFRTVHQRTTRGAPCTVGMHVGCAVWYRTSNSWPQHRHVYFFPGQVANEEEEDNQTKKHRTTEIQEDVVCDIFCHVHAQELTQAGVGGKTLVYPPPPTRKTTTTTLATRRRNGGTSNNNSHTTVASRNKSGGVNPATTERPPTNSLDTKASVVETANQLAPKTANSTASSTATTKTAPPPPQVVQTNQESTVPEATTKQPQIPNNNKALVDSVKTMATRYKVATTTKPTSTVADNDDSEKQQPAIATARTTVTSNTTHDNDNNHSDDDDDDDMNLPVIPRKKRIQERTETHPKKQKTLSQQEPVATVPGSSTAAAAATVEDSGAVPAPCDTATDNSSSSNNNNNEKTGSTETEQPPALEKRQRMRKKNIRESKLSSSRDGSKLEKIYNDIVNDMQLQLSSNAKKHNDNLEKLSILLEVNKEKWKKQLLDCHASPDALSSMWNKVKQKFERPTETTAKTGDDWSFLLVGKNYDPKRLQFLTWDTCEKLPPDGKSSNK